MSVRVCTIAGCSGVHVARGYCNNHWKRWKKYGNPLGSAPAGAHLIKPPLYVLPHGIEVIGEYAPNAKCPYWRVRIRPHGFFPGTPVVSNGIYVRRSRAILASKLGRALTHEEHAHHGDEDRDNDSANNIDALSPAEHNRHHKTGSQHTQVSKNRIRASMKRAYEEGRHERIAITNRDNKGRIAS